MTDKHKPVVFIMFNRPETTRRVLEAISRNKPRTLLIVSDGPRAHSDSDAEKIAKCRKIVEEIDWDCSLHRNYSRENMGCRKRVMTGLEWAFGIVDEAIILEDDCLPTDEFFDFCSWGLDEFRHDLRLGMVSGSNLIDYTLTPRSRNLYSRLINIWGWATWKRVWELYDPFLCINELNRLKLKLHSENMPKWQSVYWVNVIKNVLVSGSAWDFQMQYTFFMNDFLSVMPMRNLVLNIGFEEGATHTSGKIPDYVSKSAPLNSSLLMDLPIESSVMPNPEFDMNLARTIWSFRALTARRLALMNTLRFIKV